MDKRFKRGVCEEGFEFFYIRVGNDFRWARKNGPLNTMGEFTGFSKKVYGNIVSSGMWKKFTPPWFKGLLYKR